MSTTTKIQSLVSASTAVGTSVKNPDGESLGQLEEVMLDATQPRIAYAVLSFGGFLGMGDKLFAVPWESLRYDDDAECYRLNIAKETLKKAPGFDKSHWPHASDAYWSSIHDHFGVDAYWRSV